MHPETIIVRHKKERVQKCSVEPLTSRSGFRFVKYPDEKEYGLEENYLRLSTIGEPLSRSDSDKGLLILDCNWRYVTEMEKDYLKVPGRTLPLLKTAYPRCAKDNTDPKEGLATIEAIFLAFLILGRDTKGLMDQYYFRDDFLEMNRRILKGIKEM